MSKSRSEPSVEPVRDGRNRWVESKKGRKEAGLRGNQAQEVMRLHSEKQACPRKRDFTAVKTALGCCQTECDGKTFWDAEQPNRHLACGRDTRIACEPLGPVETRMCTLGTR